MIHGPGRVVLAAVQRRGGPGRLRLFSTSVPRSADFTHAVIGGGVVGLAVARALAERAARSRTRSAGGSVASPVLLLERHPSVGTETSARNSEVIHAGLYYGAGSLKTALCIKGRRQLYAFCAQHGVPHRRTGKWIVAQTPGQREALERLHAYAAGYRGEGGEEGLLPLRWVPPDEAKQREPAVRAASGILESTTTGIVDSHGLMQALLGLVEQAGGELAAGSPAVRIAPLGARGDGADGWELHIQPPGEQEAAVVTAETIVNAAGLGAAAIHNMITQRPDVPPDKRTEPVRLYYAKGNYFSYAASRPKVSTLVYPAPEPGLAGLGTHLTLDMAGRIRFGPDVEWVDDPTDLSVNSERLPQAVAAIQQYLPDIDVSALQPDYAGIRPKLAPQGAVVAGRGFADFIIRKEPGYTGWVNMLGIESPGLTSSLAIGEMVEGLLYGSRSSS